MRDGFILHEKTMAQVALLSDEQAGELLKAMIAHYQGVELEVSQIVGIIMVDARERMDSDKAAYEELAEKRTEAGRRGAAKRWQTDSKNMANDGKAIASHSKRMANDSKHMANDGESVSVSVSVNNKNNNRRFTPPTVEEVRQYCLERNNGIDAESFVAFYESKGWKVGSTPMKNWKSAVITWEKRQKEKPAGTRFSNFPARQDQAHKDLVAKVIAMQGG